jgi:hypothetical protein
MIVQLDAARLVAWILAIIAIAAALAIVLTAIRLRRPALALVAAAPVLFGLAGVAFHTVVPAPSHAVAVITGLLVALLGIVGGSPITVAVLALSARATGSAPTVPGEHGGIVVDEGTPPIVHHAEVLRGGTIIGYLERLALIAAIVLGRLEIVAVLIAVKGLGRFSELDSPEKRERFIIGTLVSLVWAGACALLIVL